MLCGLFAGRAVLSIGMMVFLAATLLHSNIISQVRQFFTTSLLLSMAFLFFIPALSGLWSENKKEWVDVLLTKLPLFAMPLAFAGSWQLSSKQWRLLGWLLITLTVCGTLWSISGYLADKAAINEAYLKAKLIETPLENDHIRFSWMVSVAVLTALLLWKEGATKWQRILLMVATAWLTIYLHIASARTGLICLYAIGLALALQALFAQKKKLVSAVTIAALVALPFLAWNLFPTFRARVAYIRYDLGLALNNQFVTGSNDGNRILSFKAAQHIIYQNPLGVGAGDVWTETHRWYDRANPGMAMQDRLLPSSEWLVYGCTAGWVGIILFTAAMAIPFFVKNIRHRLMWALLNATAAATLLFDIGLEVQFGVFLHAFFVLCWYKWLRPAEDAA